MPATLPGHRQRRSLRDLWGSPGRRPFPPSRLFRFRRMPPPFILAVILAYVLSPVAGALQRRLRIRRGLATVFTYVILLGLGALLPALFVPSLVQQLSDLNVNVQEIAALVE